jgi:hypothetical protein
MKRFSAFTAFAALVFFSLSSVFAQDMNTLSKDVQELKEGMKALQKDLNEIKTLLRSRSAAAAPQNPVINVAGAQFKGEKTAKLTLIEFSDFQ